MNLNPGDLGTISVLMKQDKSSGLTINMSVSNIATLELLMENQNMLKTHWQKHLMIVQTLILISQKVKVVKVKETLQVIKIKEIKEIQTLKRY